MTTNTGRRPLTFRPYQRTAIDRACTFYDEGKRKMVIGLPTGAGKTFTAIGLVDAFLHPSQYALILVPTIDLVKQTYKALMKYCVIDDQGIEHVFQPEQVGIIQADTNELGRHITIASKDTLDNPDRLAQYLASIGGKCALVIIDECHYGSILGYQHLVDACLLPEYGLLMGFSATPYRQDNQSLLLLFPDGFCHIEDIWDLILDGYLADMSMRDIVLEAPFDLEIQCKRLGLSTDQRYLYRYAKAYAEWKAWALGKRTIVFANNLQDAHQCAKYLTLQGHACAVVTGKTRNREEIYDAFRAGTILFLINYGVLTMGNDIEEAECTMILRDMRRSRNIGMATQMIGRILRLCEWTGKERAVVLNGSGFDITLMMFKRLIGSTKLHIPSVRQALQEKKEEQAQEEREASPEMRSLTMPIQATGREANPFEGSGWLFDSVQKEYRKAYSLKGKTYTLIAKRVFDGGYETMSVDDKGKVTTICEVLLKKFDALKTCQQHMIESQQGGVHGPDPRILDEYVGDGELKHLRNRHVPLKTSVIRARGDREEALRLDNERLKKVMKKRHYYEIVAHLDRYGGAHTEKGGHISFNEQGGVQKWGQHITRKEG